MTTVHIKLVGQHALISRDDLDHLVELAGASDTVELKTEPDDVPTVSLLALADEGGSFEFWEEEGEDVYTLADGEPL
jgi:hypothetical protein